MTLVTLFTTSPIFFFLYFASLALLRKIGNKVTECHDRPEFIFLLNLVVNVTMETWKKTAIIYVIAFVAIFLMLFLPAGTLEYWEGWIYIGIMFIPAFFVIIYFLKTDPGFLEKRFQFKETERVQSIIVKITGILFFIGFLIPGLDHRFGWSKIPIEIVILSEVIIFLNYLLVVLVFKTNRYAARTIRVEKNQQVISNGPYAIVRHPMYLGTMIMYLFTPIALGSYWALPFFLVIPIALVARILNEEELLLRKLPGYKEYCQKTRYRLIPFIW